MSGRDLRAAELRWSRRDGGVRLSGSDRGGDCARCKRRRNTGCSATGTPTTVCGSSKDRGESEGEDDEESPESVHGCLVKERCPVRRPRLETVGSKEWRVVQESCTRPDGGGEEVGRREEGGGEEGGRRKVKRACRLWDAKSTGHAQLLGKRPVCCLPYRASLSRCRHCCDDVSRTSIVLPLRFSLLFYRLLSKLDQLLPTHTMLASTVDVQRLVV